MKLIIIGAGFTGTQLAKRLISEGNDVVLIDKDEETVRHASNRLDCMVVQANGNSLDTLTEAGIAKADALVAVTESDEINMITCSLVQSVYPNVLKIARVRNDDYYSQTESSSNTQKHSLYGIDFMVHPDIEAAQAIVNAVQHGAITDVLEFDDSEYEVTRMTIEKGSKLDGVFVQNLRQISQSVFLLAYIEKDGETFMPTGSTLLEADNRIGILAAKETIPEFLELCGSKVKNIKRIALLGAGRIGTLIAEQLIQNDKQTLFSKIFGIHKKLTQDFVIIDEDDVRAKEASEKFPTASVFKADITDESFIDEEDLRNFDLVIAATRNHEQNMVKAAYFKSLGVPHTISLVSSGSFASIARNIGIDVAVPIKDAVIDSILGHLRGKGVTGLHTISEGELEIIEIHIPQESNMTNSAIKDIAQPGSFLILLVKKANTASYIIPNGNTTITQGDSLVIITHTINNKNVLDVFGASE